VTDLYEAGDINQVDGGGAGGAGAGAGVGGRAGAGDVNVNDFDDVDDYEEFDDDNEGDGGNEGNQRTAVDGGTPLAVLTYLARALSNDPDSVVIRTEERRGGLRLNLHVSPDDMGRVIGRRGRTAQAIRTLVNVAGAKDGVQATVDIVDD
jgi:predicted RNA-binding protein YlqC (UPF0109 family)